jgi:hypothetical protein
MVWGAGNRPLAGARGTDCFATAGGSLQISPVIPQSGIAPAKFPATTASPPALNDSRYLLAGVPLICPRLLRALPVQILQPFRKPDVDLPFFQIDCLADFFGKRNQQFTLSRFHLQQGRCAVVLQTFHFSQRDAVFKYFAADQIGKVYLSRFERFAVGKRDSDVPADESFRRGNILDTAEFQNRAALVEPNPFQVEGRGQASIREQYLRAWLEAFGKIGENFGGDLAAPSLNLADAGNRQVWGVLSLRQWNLVRSFCAIPESPE